MINAEIISKLTMIIGVLVIIVNILTEVIKNVFELKNSKTINIIATSMSIILSLITFVAYCQIEAITITWYMAIAFVIAGFMVAYAAMFGYDKLLSYFKNLG